MNYDIKIKREELLHNIVKMLAKEKIVIDCNDVSAELGRLYKVIGHELPRINTADIHLALWKELGVPVGNASYRSEAESRLEDS